MQFSRSHAGMLAIVSIFTGVIAPIGSYLGIGTPLPLTDKQWIAYMILALLVVIFYLVSVGSWRVMRFFSFLLIALVLSVFYLSVSDGLENMRTGYILTSLSWGWIFLSAGTILLLWAIMLEYEEFAPVITFSDKIVGIIGSSTLLCLSVVIVSITLVWPPAGQDNKSILTEFFGSGEVESQSGVLLSPTFESISDLMFDRRIDSLSFSGVQLDKRRKIEKSYSLGNRKIILTNDNRVIIDGKIQSGTLLKVFDDDSSILLRDKNILRLITPIDEKVFSGSLGNIEHITKDIGSKTFAWGENTLSGYSIYKNGEKIGGMLSKIDMIALSTSGYDIMVKGASMSGESIILKNGILLENVRENAIIGTFRSNGSHFIYVIGKAGGYRIVYDGSLIQGDFEEVREIFLERSGNSYGFFARPLGEKKYCLFTRYRGNICGLEGYMNPRISADGGSILFAGLKDNLWSIYRNTGIIIRDTKYSKKNISDDYVFFDITNPRQYLFIEKNDDGTYILRKNGKLIPIVWQDVGLDVTFGYDNKIIMTTKDDSGWRIIEL